MNNVKDLLKKHECCGCSSCAQGCVKTAIEMCVDEEGFLYPKVDSAVCNGCGRCVSICPVLNKPRSYGTPKAFAAQNTDENERLSSSSGGVFSALAKEVLKNGGVVFGAKFADGYRRVEHTFIEKEEDLSFLRGSKYLQSDINNTYIAAKKLLKEGRTVLYTGTPCEVAGLRSFLEKDFENLYTADLICHGSPSPLVWNKYVQHRESILNSNVTGVSFRSKVFGWKTFSVRIAFDNGTEYLQKLNEDVYMRGFLSDLYLRPSCHNCSFKGIQRISDITLADFWGGQKIVPEMDDDKGISLVLVNSEKGKKLMESCNCSAVEVSLERSIGGNPAAVSSVAKNPSREYFFKKMKKGERIDICIERAINRGSIRKASKMLKIKILGCKLIRETYIKVKRVIKK